jgi:hypothetical protein
MRDVVRSPRDKLGRRSIIVQHRLAATTIGPLPATTALRNGTRQKMARCRPSMLEQRYKNGELHIHSFIHYWIKKIPTYEISFSDWADD